MATPSSRASTSATSRPPRTTVRCRCTSSSGGAEGSVADSLLDRLAPDDRTRLLAAARRRRFRKGDTLFHEGDPGDALHLVEKGHVAIQTTTLLGDVATLNVLGPGDVFGEQALIAPEAVRTASAVALEA